MKPLSLPEILHDKGYLGPKFDLAQNEDMFFSLLDCSFDHKVIQAYIESLEVESLDKIMKICSSYWIRGGLPKAFLAKTLPQAFQHIQASVERGFAPILQDTMDIFDVITVELAQHTSREFSYENFFQRIRTKSRERVNLVISKLMAHGYVKAKRPYIPIGKTSYFVTYSFIDPGIISYLTDTTKPTAEWEGSTIESYAHARLDQILSVRARKSTLCYFKPYTIRDIGGTEELRFKEGEVDFVVFFGALSSGRAMGIEVKRAIDVNAAMLSSLLQATQQGVLKFGVVLYGGMPRLEWRRKIIFWPWWLI
jgi:predicted AAA+ superfamily ATPase